MNKYISQLMLSAGMVLAAASCTDYSDYNSEPETGAALGADKTLWENISTDRQLTKFAALAEKSKFSEVLNSPRFYTLWAPVDDAIGEADYQRLMNSTDEEIQKYFMQQHLTEYNYRISPALDSLTIVSLNEKHHPFTQESFDGFPYVPDGINLPSANGVMHKIKGMSEYHINLYENIDQLKGCDSLKAYIQNYDEYYLDLNASVVGPLRDGKQTYLDSVLKKRNNVISRIMNAKLEHEDSAYCMIIPDDDAWKAAYDAINLRYNYIPTLDYMDLSLKTVEASSVKATMAKAQEPAKTNSMLQDSLTCQNIVSNLVFSKCYPVNAPFFGEGVFADNDTVYTTTKHDLTDVQSLLEHTKEFSQMSNGVARVVDSLTFKSWETYSPVLSYVIPAATMKVKKLTAHNIPMDSLEKRDTLFSKVPEMIRQWLIPETSKFFSYVAVDSADVDGKTSQPEFNFALKGVRSETYHIYVVTVPGQVENPLALVKPYTLRFYLSWTDAANEQQYEILPKGSKSSLKITTANGTSTDKMIYVGDPGRVNVIDLGEFTFPVCYYGLDAYPSLMMMHTEKYNTDAQRRQNDQQMRVAGVFLVPKEYNDIWANPVNE